MFKLMFLFWMKAGSPATGPQEPSRAGPSVGPDEGPRRAPQPEGTYGLGSAMQGLLEGALSKEWERREGRRESYYVPFGPHE